MIEAKKQIVQEVLKKYTGPVEEFEFVKAEMSKMPLEELQQYAQLKSAAIRAAEADDRILELQAARAADRALHEYEMSQTREPQRKAESERSMAQDKKAFADAARTLGFGERDANLSLLRQVLGEGNLSNYSIKQVIESGAVSLTGNTE